ncbi:hypothetical protein [Streptomyces sp. NPDC057582]|uniref:hypothetical protein n=1 Tax=Streptomyces sp. NPDC057582 TaxID=3346174 RepID=UPI0036A03E53
MSTYSTIETQIVSADNGVTYAYRSVGSGTDVLPLVLLQHFRGDLDNWDPAPIDALAARTPSDHVRQHWRRRHQRRRRQHLPR